MMYLSLSVRNWSAIHSRRPGSVLRSVAIVIAAVLSVNVAHAAPVTTNLTMWLDASDLSTITMDGSNRVSAWADKSGNHYDAVQGIVGEQPTYLSSAIGGKAAIQFATVPVPDPRVEKRLMTGGGTADLFDQSEGSVFIVFKPSNIDADYEYLLTMPRVANDGGSAFFIMTVDGYFVNDDNADMGASVRKSGGYGTAHLQDVLSSDSSYIGAASYNSTQVALVVNEGNKATGAAVPVWDVATPGKGWIGGGGSANDEFYGSIAEILTYNRTLNDAERIITDNYLSSKYGINLAGNDHYGGETGINGDTGLAFDAEVFGIGRMADGSSQLLASPSTTGVGVEAASLADGTWLLAGHNGAEHGWTDDGGIERWRRVWCADVTYEQGSLSTFGLAFDFDAAGLGIDAGTPYGLLFKENDADGWEFVLTDYTVDGSRLVFSPIPLGDTPFGAADGYYTLGIVPEPGTFAMVCLVLLGLLGRRAVRFRR